MFLNDCIIMIIHSEQIERLLSLRQCFAWHVQFSNASATKDVSDRCRRLLATTSTSGRKDTRRCRVPALLFFHRRSRFDPWYLIEG